MVVQIPLENGNPTFNFYNTDGIWGGQWNLAQVWALAYPEYYSDYVSTHIQVFKDAGWLGDGIACSRFVSSIGTNQLGIIIAAAYQCAISDFDLAAGYTTALKNGLDGDNRPMGTGKLDTKEFLQYGYAPHKDKGEGPDEAFMFSGLHTLEYSYGARAVAQWDLQLGKTNDYDKLMYLSKGWERIYNSDNNFIQPKEANGQFIKNFNSIHVWRGFQEGNA